MESTSQKLINFFDIFTPKIPIHEYKLTRFRETYTKTCMGLLLNGVYPGCPNVLYSIWLVLNFMIQGMGIYILGYTAGIDLKNSQFSDATRQLSILFLLIIVLIKISNLWYHRKLLGTLVDRFNYDYKNADENFDETELNIVKSYTYTGLFLQNIWGLIVVVVGSVFPVSGVVLMLYSAFTETTVTKKMAFYCILPWFDEYKYETPLFELVFIYEIFLCIVSSFLFLGFDSIIPIFTLHICGQLELVKVRLMNVFGEGVSALETRQRISAIVKHLQDVYKYSEDVNTVSSSVYETIFSATPLLSTAAAFQTYSCLKNGELPYEFALFFISTIVHIFIPSYYGDLMIEQSLSVFKTAYACKWENQYDKSACSTLIVIMLRAQRPLQLSTMFKPVSLMLFSEACQQSWTIFNLLRAVFE